jgi:hypothetical protein
MSRHRHRRTFDPAAAFPSPVEPGELIVNTSNRQLAVGDASAATLGVPKPLIGVRFFDTTARYVANDLVVQAGGIYRANGTIPPGAFNGANWTQLGVVTTMPAGSVVFTPTGNVIATDVQGAITEVDAEKVAKAGDTMTGHLALPTGPADANAVRKDYVDAIAASASASIATKVAKTGDTMTGPLVLPADPTAALQAATRQYVDAASAAGAAALDTKVAKTGDTMTGHLALPTSPAAANAVRKDYVDAAIAAVPAAPVAATAAEYVANSAPTKFVSPKTAWDAAALLAVGPIANVTLDFSTALDFYVTLNGVGTMNNPTAPKNGQKGVIYLVQDTTGGRTITTWGNKWKFPGGVKPTLSTAPSSIDAISYVVLDQNTFVACTFSAGFA